MKLLLIQVTRNKQGQPSRAQQSLTADNVRVGRGSDCKLFLADPRVSLHHALIGRADDRHH
jgi:pSer/pThr/pTyr-binding forkhead associated (FHA) protein